ncbi:Plasma membrane protein, partial [Phytophthora megakarya]
LLLEKGANFKQQDLYGSTALHAACYRDHYAIAMILVNSGMAIDFPDKDGELSFLEFVDKNGSFLGEGVSQHQNLTDLKSRDFGCSLVR